MVSRFEPNPAFPAESVRTEELGVSIGELVGVMAEGAQQDAPYRTGALEASIEGGVALIDGHWVGRVWASDFKARWHEFGTRYMDAHPFLRPQLERALPGAPIVGGGETGE